MQPEYMTKQANDDLIVITRKKLIELMNLQCRMRYMLTLLGAICCKKKVRVYDDATGRVRLPENRLQDL